MDNKNPIIDDFLDFEINESKKNQHIKKIEFVNESIKEFIKEKNSENSISLSDVYKRLKIIIDKFNYIPIDIFIEKASKIPEDNLLEIFNTLDKLNDEISKTKNEIINV